MGKGDEDAQNMQIVETILTKIFTFGFMVARVATGAVTPGQYDVKKEVNFARDLARGAAKAE